MQVVAALPIVHALVQGDARPPMWLMSIQPDARSMAYVETDTCIRHRALAALMPQPAGPEVAATHLRRFPWPATP